MQIQNATALRKLKMVSCQDIWYFIKNESPIFDTQSSAMEQDEAYKLLGRAIERLRILRGETTDSMAYKLGYKFRAGYIRLEKGKFKTLDLHLLNRICKTLEISPVNLCQMAGINLLSNFTSGQSEKYRAYTNDVPLNPFIS